MYMHGDEHLGNTAVQGVEDGIKTIQRENDYLEEMGS